MKDGSPNHTGAISIEGKNGISVTADNGGKIEISGHEKPAILTSTSNQDTDTDKGYLVSRPGVATNADWFLNANGGWTKPKNTEVMFTGYRKNSGADTEAQTYTSKPTENTTKTQAIESLRAGTSIELVCDHHGNLTINGPETGLNVVAGTGLTADETTDTTKRILNLSAATDSTLGGVKVGNLGTGIIGDIQGGDLSQTIYAPPASGKYYPIETVASGDHSGHAVVKIPDVPSPFYDDAADENKFSIAIENYKSVTYMGNKSVFVTGDVSYASDEIIPFLSDINAMMDENDRIDSEAKFNQAIKDGALVIKDMLGLSIVCPSNVLFAQLDCSMEAYGLTMATFVKSTKNSNGRQTISIMNSCPNAGFESETSYIAYLRFTTADQLDTNNNIISKGHTYNATVKITYSSGMYGAAGTYTSDIIF